MHLQLHRLVLFFQLPKALLFSQGESTQVILLFWVGCLEFDEWHFLWSTLYWRMIVVRFVLRPLTLMRTPAAQNTPSNTVDICNQLENWSTSQLSVARSFLAATTAYYQTYEGVSFFAGGWDGSELWCWKGEEGS